MFESPCHLGVSKTLSIYMYTCARISSNLHLTLKLTFGQEYNICVYSLLCVICWHIEITRYFGNIIKIDSEYGILALFTHGGI